MRVNLLVKPERLLVKSRKVRALLAPCRTERKNFFYWNNTVVFSGRPEELSRVFSRRFALRRNGCRGVAGLHFFPFLLLDWPSRWLHTILSIKRWLRCNSCVQRLASVLPTRRWSWRELWIAPSFLIVDRSKKTTAEKAHYSFSKVSTSTRVGW